ncbi:hypothetical protein GCM10023185_08070 [Hymenobacter saemangeumensis]|uniref:WG repeat-containing protein n=1 Tax=Hymenobacter saemangeumensis TaxID=1084522 RepID=A0ABP8I3J0_9BACT
MVQVLQRVPLPPGGLVPYRKGRNWGYADTTGRVVVQPVLLEEPPFFMQEFIFLSLSDIPLFFSHYGPGNLPQPRKEYYQSICLINARGEILLLNQGKNEVPLLLPDGSIRAGRQEQHIGQPMLRYGSEAGRAQWTVSRVPADAARYRHGSRVQRYPVGAGRYAAYRTYSVDQRRGKRRGPAGPRAALTDSVGRRLTGWYFGSIARFHNGRALVRDYRPHRYRPIASANNAAEPHTADLLYLDRQGRELRLPQDVAAATDFTQGTAVLWRKVTRGRHPSPAGLSQGGIMDTMGRMLLPITSRLQGPDEAGFFRITQSSGADTAVRFITPQAAPACGGRAFRRAGPFFNNRAWVQAADGRQGLIDTRGQWVTPAADYELLVSVAQRFRPYLPRKQVFIHSLPVAVSAFAAATYANRHPADTAYMLCRRAGKYGWVARRSGREVIPTRYDSVLYYLSDGLACAMRGGQAYLINAKGRELARGEYRGDWYDYRGQPRHLFRPAEGTWSVVDTSGRPRLPWLPGTGFFTPEGRAIVQEPYAPGWKELPRRKQEFPCVGVVDSAGHVVVPFQDGLQYSGMPPTAHLASIALEHHYPPLFWLTTETAPASSGAYRTATPRGGYSLLSATTLQPFTTGSFSSLRLLSNNWHVGRRVADTLSVLIAANGQQWAAPRGYTWSREILIVGAGLSQQHEERLPFQYGVDKVLWDNLNRPPSPYELLNSPRNEGYLTKGGRRLWED